MTDEIELLKQKVAYIAAEYVQSGMVVGLGSGTTASLAVRRLGEKLRAGVLHDILGIPTSSQIEQDALRLGIPLTTLEEHPHIDLTIDGADEVDPNLNLIKGGGGALLHEKIVAQATLREIIIVDETKLSPVLGTHWAVPVEVTPFGWGPQADYVRSLGAHIKVRQNPDGSPYHTDQNNLILDCEFGPIHELEKLAHQLKSRPGIVEHGLFLGLASEVIVASQEGIRHLNRP